MNWTELKKVVYDEEPDFRDLKVEPISKSDWRNWFDYVQVNYPTTMTIDRKIILPKPTFGRVEEFWDEDNNHLIEMAVDISSNPDQKFIVNCRFFDPFTFDNDFHKNSVKSLDEHSSLIQYMRNISKIFNKPVHLTIDLMDKILITVIQEDLYYES